MYYDARDCHSWRARAGSRCGPQQTDSAAPTVWRYGYDAADQLTSAVHQTTTPTPAVLARYAYAYDLAGNRTIEQMDDAVTVTTHDALNRLVTQAPGGVVDRPVTGGLRRSDPFAVTWTGTFMDAAERGRVVIALVKRGR